MDGHYFQSRALVDFTLAHCVPTFLVDRNETSMGDTLMTSIDIIVTLLAAVTLTLLGRGIMRRVLTWATAEQWHQVGVGDDRSMPRKDALAHDLSGRLQRGASRKSVQKLKESDCRWPIGDPKSPVFHFCGHAKLGTLPYCEVHAREAFQSSQPMRHHERDKIGEAEGPMAEPPPSNKQGSS